MDATCGQLVGQPPLELALRKIRTAMQGNGRAARVSPRMCPCVLPPERDRPGAETRSEDSDRLDDAKKVT